MATKIDSNKWYRLEGFILPKNKYNYSGSVTSLDSLKEGCIWYTKVEVQFQNPSVANFVHGVNYKVREFEDYGCATIVQIAEDPTTVIQQIIDENKENDSSATYSQPFVIKKSSVILYGDAHNDILDKYVVVLIDETFNDSLVGISATYEGPPVPMGDEINLEDVVVTGVFTDGHKSRVQSGYFLTRAADNVNTNEVNAVGTCLFIATVNTGENAENTFTASFAVPCVKKLERITASYDGPSIPIGKSPKKKNIIVKAIYTDGSASTVTDWSFSQGNKITENNNGVLEITYRGKYCNVRINNYATYETQLKAFYNGNRVEVGAHFQKSNVTVKVCYSDINGLNNSWELLQDGEYDIPITIITREGANVFEVSYTTKSGSVLTTNFTVIGFKPQKAIDSIEAIYTGPPIRVGKTFNEIKVMCKAHYNDDTVSEIDHHNFTLSTTLIDHIGENVITITYDGAVTTFTVVGIESQDTTGTTYSPTDLDLLYPEMSKVNFRRRGPIESEKLNNYNKDIYDNIVRLNTIYSELYERYNYMVNNISSLSNVGINTLNTCVNIQERLYNINKLL